MGESLPQFGLAVGFPCNAIFKNNPEQKQKRDNYAFTNSLKNKQQKKSKQKTHQPKHPNASNPTVGKN